MGRYHPLLPKAVPRLEPWSWFRCSFEWGSTRCPGAERGDWWAGRVRACIYLVPVSSLRRQP
jgi:hypothetical protein